MTCFTIALLYANAAEWCLHRFVLHGVGKKRTSFWHFHWGEHHRNSRRNGHYDADYRRSPFGWHAQGKELYSLLGLLLLHTPLLWLWPYFFAGLCYATGNYLYKHRRAHLDPDWARKHLRWHYDHHMGKNQDANWCVTRPFFDWIMGTRVHYPDPAAAQPSQSNAAEVEETQEAMPAELSTPAVAADHPSSPPPSLEP